MSPVTPCSHQAESVVLVPIRTGDKLPSHSKLLLQRCLPMPLLFSYGTLQQETVQMSTFGRLLPGQPDELIGFEQSLLRIEDPQFVATSGKAHHFIVKFNGRNDSRVRGTVLEISETELAKADQYEPAGYKRISVALASGRQAWVYADARFS